MMELRRAIMAQGLPQYKEITVEWNQWLQPLTSSNWQPYNATRAPVTFDDVNEISTTTWAEQGTGYSTSVRNKVGTLQSSGQIWYVSHMVNPSLSGYNWGVEFAGGRQDYCISNAPANTWSQASSVNSYYRGTRNYTYIGNCKNAASQITIGMTVQCKSPILINLTQMFGAGNEPSKARFEALCALNNIDLTVYHAYNEGTQQTWLTV